MVEDIDAATEFFAELGLELEGRAPIEGGWADGSHGVGLLFYSSVYAYLAVFHFRVLSSRSSQ